MFQCCFLTSFQLIIKKINSNDSSRNSDELCSCNLKYRISPFCHALYVTTYVHTKYTYTYENLHKHLYIYIYLFIYNM